jgi:hypothetical protein
VNSPQHSSLVPYKISKPFEHLYIECLINSVAPSGTDSKWMITLMSKKVDHHLIMDFDIHGFLGMGEFFDVHSMDWYLASGSY